MKRVRFAPSPTGSLHVGNALSAVANRDFGDWLLLRIDDTDAARNVAGGEEAILRDLGGWASPGTRARSGRASGRSATARRRRRSATVSATRRCCARTARPRTSWRASSTTSTSGSRTSSAGTITARTRRSTARCHEALGAEPPEYIHHGLILGPDGRKLSKREGLSSIADLRDAGIPAEAVRTYLDELGLPRHDVHLDPARIRRLAVEALAAMSDQELAERADAPLELVPALRGARDLNEAREYVRLILEPQPAMLPDDARPTLERFRELANGDGHAVVRELKAVGGDLKALRLALTGRDKGPELAAIIDALPRDEALRRIDAAL